MFDKNTLLVIGSYLQHRKQTIAVAESVTSGLIQSAFASIDNASRFYEGGITTYNLGQKCRHLLIEPIHAQACNCVSQKVAESMAANVCLLFNSHWGIGITGYAAPVPEADNALYAYYAITKHQQIILSKKVTADNKEPPEVQLFYVDSLLTDLKQLIEELTDR